MRKMRKLIWLTLLVFLVSVPVAFSQSEPSDEEAGVLVGRISHVEGELLRYVPDDEDWVATIKDAPFGLDDALYSDEKGRAEFIMPNGTWVRIDGSTQIQMIALKADVTEIDVASGVARFYNKGPDTVIKATTPFGYVVAPPGTTFDMYVGDESVEVIAMQGRVEFILESDESRYEVASGSSSIIADSREVTSGDGTVDADWDDWNLARDDSWSKRLLVKGDSVKYLPEQLHDDAYELEENGKWEEVEYEGESRRLWRPARVAAGWQPFSAGRWTVYHGDNCWVPDEPFGYVTHHYGNWVYVGNYWYWAPPVVRVRVAAPVLGIGFGWYPGRVAWIHSDVHVGWVPLAHNEIYYSHYRWGRRAVLINSVNINRINININNYRYVNRAIIVNQNNFYNVRNYRNVRITNINRTVIVNKYRGTPVINNTVIKGYNSNRQRFNFTDARVVRKPHNVVVGRIQRNQKLAGEVRAISARDIRQNAARTKEGRVVKDARIERPKVTNRLVAPGEVKKPKGEVKFQERQLKAKARTLEDRKSRREAQPEAVERKRPEARPGRPPVTGEDGRRVRPQRPERPEREVGPGQGGERRPPVEEQRRMRREKPERPEREVGPGQGGERRAPDEVQRRLRREKPERPEREVGPGQGGERRAPVEEQRRMRREKPERPAPEVGPGQGRERKKAPVEEQGRLRRERPGREMQTERPVEQQNSRRQLREDRRQRQEQMMPQGAGQQQGQGRQIREPRKGQMPPEQMNQGNQRQQQRAAERRKQKQLEDAEALQRPGQRNM